MSQISDRYRNAAARFGARVREVPADKWDSPTPCEEWVARDVIRHLGWVPSFFAGAWGLEAPIIPSVDDDPVGAWEAVNAFAQSSLDDEALATSTRDTPMGTMSFEDAFAMIALGDVVVHTWDLARATGLDETLDANEVQALLAAMDQLPDEMRGEHFGPKLDVADDADDQTKMLAFSGRRA